MSAELKAPEGFSAVGKDGCVYTEWEEVEGATGYKLYFFRAENPDRCIKSRYAQSCAKTILGFKNGSDYLVSVCAFALVNGREAFGEISEKKPFTPICEGLKAQSAICMKTGETARIECEYDGIFPNVTFVSEDKDIADVDAMGIVTAKKSGVTYIKITSNDKKTFRTKIAVDRALGFGEGKAVLMLAGDIMCAVNHQRSAANYSYDFHEAFSAIKSTLDKADYRIGVLETSCYDDAPFEHEQLRLSGGAPNCNSPSTFISAISDAGFDGLVTANNHNCDTGRAGLEATVSEIKRMGMKNFGTLGDNPVVVDVKGFKIGIIACCMVSNGLENNVSDSSSVVNVIGKYDKDYFVELINTAYSMGAEYIIAYQHWGGMNTTAVRKIQTDAAKYMAQAGADLIVGSHPHVVQRFSYIGTTDGRIVPCAYSLGNFLTTMNEMRENRDGAILRVELSRSDGKVKAKMSYIPCFCENREHGASVVLAYPPHSEATRDSFARTKQNIGQRINHFSVRPKLLLSGSEFLSRILTSGRGFRLDKTAMYISQISLGSKSVKNIDCGEDAKLALEIKKELSEYIKSTAPDYLAVDLYAAGTYSVQRLGAPDEHPCYFSNTSRFIKSPFYADHKEKFVRVRPPFGETIWKPLIRKYAEALLSAIPHDRIILFRCNMTSNKFKGSELRTANVGERQAKFIKQMEDYFIKLVNPAVVELSDKFFTDADKPEFETAYYRNAYKAALEITSGKGISRVFTPDPDIWFDRVMKYYDNMTARSYQSRLLNLELAADKIISSTSKTFASNNRKRLLKLKAAGSCELSCVRDFFIDDEGAENVIRAAEIIDAVEKGKLDLPYDFFEPAFTGHFNIVKTMVRRLSAEIGASVNENSAELVFLIRGKPQLKRYITSLNRNTIDIWGSCVSRETLNQCAAAHIGKYIFKQAAILAYEPPIEEEFPEGAEAFCNNKWRRRMLRDAFNKNGFETLDESDAHWIMIDFYDLICKMAEYKGGLFEVDDFILRTDFYKKIKSDCKECWLFEKRTMKYCFEEISRFAKEISEIYGENIILIKTEPKNKYITLDYRLEKLADEGMYEIKKKFISLCEERFASVTKCFVIDISKYFYSSDKFPLGGAHIVHYEAEFYRRAAECVTLILNGSEQKIYSTVDDNYILLRDMKLKR